MRAMITFWGSILVTGMKCHVSGKCNERTSLAMNTERLSHFQHFSRCIKALWNDCSIAVILIDSRMASR